MNEVESDEEERKVTPKAIARLVVVLTIAAASTGAWVYIRYYVPKAGLGGPCQWAMHCKAEAPRCMRPSVEGEGVCSHPCDADAGDCAPGVRCVSVELDEERDERGVPLKSGYCFPQAFIDGKKKPRVR